MTRHDEGNQETVRARYGASRRPRSILSLSAGDRRTGAPGRDDRERSRVTSSTAGRGERPLRGRISREAES